MKLPNKYISSVLILGLLGLIVIKGIVPGFQMQSDFPNYYSSSKILVETGKTKSFYDNDWFLKESQKMGFEYARFAPFPPLTCLIMTPLTFVNPLLAKRIWLIFNIIIGLLTILKIKQLSEISWLNASLTLMISGLCLASNFKLGQLYLIIMLLLLIVYEQYQKGRFRSAAIILMSISCIKYLPIIYLFSFRQRKMLIYSAISLFSLAIIQLLLLGTDTTMAYLAILFNHLDGNIPGQGAFPKAFQSFNSFFGHVFVFDPIENPDPIIDWPFGKTIFRIIPIGVVGYFIYKFNDLYKESGKEILTDIRLILLGFGIMTVLPAGATYHFLLLILPLTILIKRLKTHLSNVHIAILGFILLAVFNIHFNLLHIDLHSAFLNLILDFPRLWLTCTLFFYVMFLLKKHKNNLLQTN
jgi:hypothetical protein